MHRPKLAFSRSVLTVLVAAVLAVPALAGASGGPASPATPPWTAKVAPGLLAHAGEARTVLDCIVVFRPAQAAGSAALTLAGARRTAWIKATADQLEHDYSGIGARMVDRYTHLPLAHLSVPADVLEAIASDPRIEAVRPNRTAHAFRTDGESLMQVPAVRALGYNGAGIGVAVLDTGVDYTHPELSPGGTDASAKTIKLWDAINGDADPMDDEGHGTSVAGIVGGAGGSSHGAGVAPSARIVAVKVLDHRGSGESAQILAGIDKVLESINAGNPYNIKVLNMSLGGYYGTETSPEMPPQPCDDDSPEFVTAFQALNDAGVLITIASGNGGCSDGVAWPACITQAMAVGAVYASSLGYANFPGPFKSPCNYSTGCHDTGANGAVVACYTDSGEKIDVWAPAHCSDTPTWNSGSTGGYETCFGGTSAAAPYVAGVAALLSQAVPNRSAQALRDAIRYNGDDVTDPRNGVTRKRVRADLDLTALQTSCVAVGVPSNLTLNAPSSCAGYQVVLTWDAVSGAGSYTVEIAADQAFATRIASPTVSAPSLATTLPDPGASRIYLRVRSNSSCNVPSAFSTSVALDFGSGCGTPSYSSTSWVSGIGHLPGLAPSYWYSDLAVLNPASSTAQLRLTFRGSAAPSPTLLNIGPHHQLSWPDVVPKLGVAGTDVGDIAVESTAPVIVQARTYSQTSASAPTWGQSYPGLASARALPYGQVGYLANLRSDAPFRTNVEFVNVTNGSVTVETTFFANDGTQLGSPLSTTIPGLRRAAGTPPPPNNNGAAFAEVRVQTAGAAVIAFASVIDGASTDPTTVDLAVPTGAASTTYVSGIAHTPGIAPSYWYSDLAILNPGSAAAQLTLTFNGVNATLHSGTISLPAHRQLTWHDVLTQALGLTGQDVGALVVSGNVPLVVAARTYSRSSASAPTFGQSYPGLAGDSAITYGKVGYLGNLRSDGSFRTNVEVVNTGSASVDVEFRFFANGGTQVGSLTRTVAAGRRDSVTQALPSGLPAAYAEVRVLTPGGAAIAFASVIDGTSTDPTTVGLVIP